MDYRLSIFLLISSGVLLLLGVLILLLINVLWNKITIKIQLQGMALRRDQRKRIVPVLGIVRNYVQQSSREIIAQVMINEGIVEELMQSDVLSKLQSLPAVKLILYELILLVSQQNMDGRGRNTEEGNATYGRITNVLLEIKDLLRDISVESEEVPLRAIEKRNGKEFTSNERAHRSKQKLLSTYYQQYCALVDQLERYAGQQGQQMQKQKMGAEEALIDQLQSLVFKKESVIQNLERYLQQQKNINLDLENQLTLIKYQHQALFQEKLLLEQERQKLQEEIQSLAKLQPPSESCSSFIEAGKGFWSDSQQVTAIPRKQSQIPQHDLLKCLISQALTIQALIQ